MKLLTIGEFARLARLSPKALRMYDELGLLRPSRVDAWTGYRYYAPPQLERARLVAWLRRLGMPLAQIGPVLDAPPAEAAALVAAFLRLAEADLAERQRLAQFLISYLREGASAMPDPVHPTPPAPRVPSGSSASPASSEPAAAGPPLTIRYAAASDAGLIRERNQDVGYAGPRLIAVADGFGPAGERASAAAIGALRRLEAKPPGVVPADLLNVLADALSEANASVRSITESDPELAGSGSTLTAMLLSGSRLALVHVGDTRAYLFRDGGLFQLTHDHSATQLLIDTGRLTPEEAASHPQRSLLINAVGDLGEAMFTAALPKAEQAAMPLLLRAFGAAGEAILAAGRPEAQAAAGRADLSLLDAQPGDRYLLCSDGLTTVIPVAVIRKMLSATDLSPAEVVRRLITLANEAGGPDNIACALADIVAAA